jgi:hypothetical protein
MSSGAQNVLGSAGQRAWMAQFQGLPVGALCPVGRGCPPWNDLMGAL